NARVQGVVIVEALIGPDGKVADVKILRSIPLLDQAAVEAVRQWQFTPTLLNGTPVPVIMTCTVNFTLEGPQPIEVKPEGAPPAAAALVPQEGASVPAGGVYKPGSGVTIPRVISEQKPSYEPTAYQEKVQGTVVVEAVVGPDGAVQDVKVVKGLDPRLDDKAIEAAYKWRFVPGTKNGVAVPVLMTIEMMFSLR
ncbi:MAG: energy transducer TonB, partial [Bacteroidales bacterium]